MADLIVYVTEHSYDFVGELGVLQGAGQCTHQHRVYGVRSGYPWKSVPSVASFP